MTTAAQRQARRHAVGRLADTQDGVISRAQLRQLGVTASAVHAEVHARRWRVLGRNTVCTHTGDVRTHALWHYAVWESGSGAALDGVTALEVAGVTGIDGHPLHVSIAGGRSRRRVPGVVPHYLRARMDGELLGTVVPVVRPAVAALRAAAWASSDRQAVLWLVLPVQQRILRADHLLTAAECTGSRQRRGLIAAVVRDIAAGAQSLNELDFAAACRARGLPEPDRQVVCRTPGGRFYLDVRWATLGLVVEIDGFQHTQGIAPVEDALRQNEISLRRDTVLRVPVLAFRLDPARVMDQVARAHAILTARAYECAV